ncbi:MAG: SsrA-binding protein SmpB [Paludibacteraceae bacterium]|nr:SsrA-binding protein SmpB [Paludibacteraceae bacterium]
MKKNDIYIKNKKASFDYAFLDEWTAGIVLSGTEIKSIRQSKVNLTDSFCYFNGNELWLKGMNVAAYAYGSYNNHQPQRDRKLLLTRKELRKLQQEAASPGLTIVPTALFINERGLCKVKIALAKGKKEFDKRETIKENEAKREMARARRNDY